MQLFLYDVTYTDFVVRTRKSSSKFHVQHTCSDPVFFEEQLEKINVFYKKNASSKPVSKDNHSSTSSCAIAGKCYLFFQGACLIVYLSFVHWSSFMIHAWRVTKLQNVTLVSHVELLLIKQKENWKKFNQCILQAPLPQEKHAHNWLYVSEIYNRPTKHLQIDLQKEIYNRLCSICKCTTNMYNYI